jgi:membrane-associated phospholipid phosphatase
VIALVTMLVAQPSIKEIIDRPRPDSTQVEVRAQHTSKSFPSGHSMSTTTVWGAAALLAVLTRRRWLAAGLCVPIVLTGFSSSIQGVHWPSDAIAGTLLGLIAAVLIATVVSENR